MDETNKDLGAGVNGAQNNDNAATFEERGELEVYEIGFQVIPDVPEEEMFSAIEKIRATLGKYGANIISEGSPELRDLSYEMSKKIGGKFRKFNRGYFGWIKFDLSKENILSIKKEIEAMELVLRFMIIRTVRENTLISQRAPVKRQEPEGGAGEGVTAEVIDEEIEKTLEDLEIK